MQYDLREGIAPVGELPVGYELVPWSIEQLKSHAEAKYRSFRMELDSNVFPCLGDADGCLNLMKEISCRQGFLPSATWLVRYHNMDSGRIENIGTVQGIRDQIEVASIQNLGIVPAHRGLGLGSALLRQSLRGFQSAGMNFVTLEVTSHNTGAVRLYERIGFRIVRTVFKSIDISYV